MKKYIKKVTYLQKDNLNDHHLTFLCISCYYFLIKIKFLIQKHILLLIFNLNIYQTN